MKFNSFSFSAAVVTAVVAGSALTTSPAQAFDIYSRTLSFGAGKAAMNGNNSVTTLDFFDKTAGAGTPTGTAFIAIGSDSEFGAVLKELTFKDLSLEKTSITTWSLFGGQVNDFISGMDNGIKFTLTAFNLTKSTNGFLADIDGFFTAPPKFPSVAAAGGLSTQSGLTKLVFTGSDLIETKSGSSFSGDITAVPTPALLPGLLGLGVAALRKRKTAATEKASAQV